MALAALRQKKAYEGELDRIAGTRLTLSAQVRMPSLLSMGLAKIVLLGGRHRDRQLERRDDARHEEGCRGHEGYSRQSVSLAGTERWLALSADSVYIIQRHQQGRWRHGQRPRTDRGRQRNFRCHLEPDQHGHRYRPG